MAAAIRAATPTGRCARTRGQRRRSRPGCRPRPRQEAVRARAVARRPRRHRRRPGGRGARRAARRSRGFRLLCAHRRGQYGVATSSARVEAWLGEAVPGSPPRHVVCGATAAGHQERRGAAALQRRHGRDGAHGRGRGHQRRVERHEEIVEYAPARLGAIETVRAMTIPTRQGSQFGTAAVLLPPPDSPLLTRELLYTGVTARTERLLLAGSEEAIHGAVTRPVARASGCGAALGLTSMPGAAARREAAPADGGPAQNERRHRLGGRRIRCGRVRTLSELVDLVPLDVMSAMPAQRPVRDGASLARVLARPDRLPTQPPLTFSRRRGRG